MSKMVRTNYVFVGECRSLTAIRNNWSWADGRLAAKPLFEALRAMGVQPEAQSYVNIYEDPPLRARHTRTPTAAKISDHTVASLRITPWIIVALGSRVSGELVDLGIDHVAIVHPAARGKIRKRSRYIKHVADKLTPRKVMRVEWNIGPVLERRTHNCECFYLQDSRGRWRLQRDPSNGQYAPSGGEYVKWMRSIGVTHVEPFNDYHDELPDGVYPIAKWSRWINKKDRESIAECEGGS